MSYILWEKTAWVIHNEISEEVLLFYFFLWIMVLICSLKFNIPTEYLRIFLEPGLQEFCWKISEGKSFFETCQKKIIHEPVWLDQDKSSCYTEMPFHLSFLSQYSSQDQIKYDRSRVFLFVQLKGIPKRFWKF